MNNSHMNPNTKYVIDKESYRNLFKGRPIPLDFSLLKVKWQTGEETLSETGEAIIPLYAVGYDGEIYDYDRCALSLPESQSSYEAFRTWAAEREQSSEAHLSDLCVGSAHRDCPRCPCPEIQRNCSRCALCFPHEL